MFNLKTKLLFIPIVFFLLYMAGCKSDSTVDPGSNGNVSVGYFTQSSQGDNILIIDQAKFIVRKLELEQGEGEGDHGEDFDVNLGPFVVNLDLTQKVVVAAVAVIPAGNYHEIKFQIHKLSPNESVSDPDFVEGNPPHNRYSVIVRGSFNGVPFVYKSWVTFAREIEFENQPISLSEVTSVNITIKLDLFTWFDSNGVILDPTDPANRPLIDQNIRESFRSAFRDLNKDGDPD